MLTARVIGTETFRFLEPITMAGLLYFLVSYPSALIIQRLEARYAKKTIIQAIPSFVLRK